MGVGRAALLEHDDKKNTNLAVVERLTVHPAAFNCNGVEHQKTRWFLAFIVSLKSESIPIYSHSGV